jgi:hypothetical protein
MNPVCSDYWDLRRVVSPIQLFAVADIQSAKRIPLFLRLPQKRKKHLIGAFYDG